MLLLLQPEPFFILHGKVPRNELKGSSCESYPSTMKRAPPTFEASIYRQISGTLGHTGCTHKPLTSASFKETRCLERTRGRVVTHHVHSVTPSFHSRPHVSKWTFVSIPAMSHRTFDLSAHLVNYHSEQEGLKEESPAHISADFWSWPTWLFPPSYLESCLCSCLSL